jgi:hypothetical protein
MSVGSVVTTTEEGLTESGMCESLSGCWACTVFLSREVSVLGHVCCIKVPTKEVGHEHEHREHAVHAGCMQWIITHFILSFDFEFLFIKLSSDIELSVSFLGIQMLIFPTKSKFCLMILPLPFQLLKLNTFIEGQVRFDWFPRNTDNSLSLITSRYCPLSYHMQFFTWFYPLD